MNQTVRTRPIIDLRIPIPVVAALLVQTAAIVWYASAEKQELSGRVQQLEQWVNSNDKLLERVTRVEEKVTGIKEQSLRIEQKLDEALGRGKR